MSLAAWWRACICCRMPGARTTRQAPLCCFAPLSLLASVLLCCWSVGELVVAGMHRVPRERWHCKVRAGAAAWSAAMARQALR